MKVLTVFLLFIVISTSELEIDTRQNETDSTEKHRELPSSGLRIIGGKNAKDGQFPHQVALQIRLTDESTLCGGILISKRSILSAAHCCEGATEITVVLGTVQLYNRTDPNRRQMRVSGPNIKVHENWESRENINDICILRLPEEVTLSKNIDVAELPKDDSRDFNGQSVIASGWGRMSDFSNSISPVLKYAKLTVISNFFCRFYYFGTVRDTNICTSGRSGVSTCNGDSGGPLVLEENDQRRAMVVGITSFGSSRGCNKGFPAVFTRVSKYLRWIERNMDL